MSEPIKYAVVCDCDNQPNVIAWIDDDRVTGDNPWVTHSDADTRKTVKGRANANGEFVTTDRFQHPPCGRDIRLNDNHIGELLDAVAEVQRQIGYESIPVSKFRGETPFEERIVIPFELLCRLNGRLQRR